MENRGKYNYEKYNNRITHLCRYHVFWCTTFRRPVLEEAMRIRIKELILGICQDKGITVENLVVGTFYVYLRADMPPIDAVNNMVRNLKRNTSRISKEFPALRSRLPSLWTLHYFLSTEEEAPREKIKEWMEAQPRFMPKKKAAKTERSTQDGNQLG